MSLTFRNRRFVPPLDYEDPIAEKGPWLNAEVFTPAEKEQLRAVVACCVGRSLPDHELFTGGYDTFEEMCEVSIEWWDIVDDDGAVRYQLWLFSADTGSLFANASTELVGRICQFGFESDDPELGIELQEACVRARRDHPGTDLTTLPFRFHA